MSVRVALDTSADVAPKSDKICPMQIWLDQRGYTQRWLAAQLKPSKAGKPVNYNLVYMWFTRRKKPSDARISEMAGLTRGDVKVGELKAWFAASQVIRRRTVGPARTEKKPAVPSRANGKADPLLH